MNLTRRVFLRMLGLAVASEALTLCRLGTCYVPAPVPTEPASSENLKVQAQLLTEMGAQGGLKAETLARVRASVQRDLALLAQSEGHQ